MSGHIQNYYRELEAKYENLLNVAKIMNGFSQLRLHGIHSGNIWENCRVHEQNIETLTTFINHR